MHTQVVQNGDVTVVKVTGRLDIDQAGPFRQACLSQLCERKVIFNLSDLTFVGSTGIHSFFQTVNELHCRAPFGVRIVGLNRDFLRILLARPENGAPCLTLMDEAIQSFLKPPESVPEATQVLIQEVPRESSDPLGNL